MSKFFETIGWYPTIGDPSFMGWFTVITYLAAFVLGFRIALTSKDIFVEHHEVQRYFWISISCLMFLLCINKQLDLQSLLTATGRYILKEQGLYEYKRHLQILFISGVLLVGLVLFLLIIKKLYQVVKEQIFAIVGTVFLFMFILIRASSFHNMDAFIGSSVLGFKMNWLLELTGIGLILFNAIILLRKMRKITHSSERV